MVAGRRWRSYWARNWETQSCCRRGFPGEGFSDSPVIGVVGMNGEDPGQALVVGVGGDEVVRVQALG